MNKRAMAGAFAMAFAMAVGPTLFSGAAVAQTGLFKVELLPNDSAGGKTAVSSINTAGDAAGLLGIGSSSCSNGCPVVWSGGRATMLGSVSAADLSEPNGINNSGQVVGAADFSGLSQAVVWNNGTPSVLPPPSGSSGGYASSINDAGSIVGASGDPQIPTVWNGLSPMTLDLLTGYTSGYAVGINNNGLIVGSLCCYKTYYSRAVVWHGTTPSLLPAISSSNPGSKALAVNKSGLVVGTASVPETDQVGAVAWSNGTITSLGTLGGTSYAYAINDRGIIVGESKSDSGDHAVVWSRIGAKTEDLNALITATAASEVLLMSASGINNSCSIVASGLVKKTSLPVAYLLTITDPSKCVNGGF